MAQRGQITGKSSLTCIVLSRAWRSLRQSGGCVAFNEECALGLNPVKTRRWSSKSSNGPGYSGQESVARFDLEVP